MKKAWIVLVLAVCLSGCNFFVGGVAKTVGSAGEAVRKDAPQSARQDGEEGNAASRSLMAQLDETATLEDMVRAFEQDFQRAAQEVGVSKSYEDLFYEESDGTGTVYLENGMMIYIDPPSTYHRVWYVGYPDTMEWMLLEAQLVLIACDPSFSTGDAADYIEDLFDDAWDNRNNMPSAVMEELPGGYYCSLSLNDNGLVSYWISFGL